MINVSHESDSDFTVTAKGENACFRDGTHPALALETSAETLEPKNVHPYIIGLVVGQYGFEITLNEIDDETISIVVTL